MSCRIPCYFTYHGACFNLAFIWSPVVCSEHPFGQCALLSTCIVIVQARSQCDFVRGALGGRVGWAWHLNAN